MDFQFNRGSEELLPRNPSCMLRSSSCSVEAGACSSEPPLNWKRGSANTDDPDDCQRVCAIMIYVQFARFHPYTVQWKIR